MQINKEVSRNSVLFDKCLRDHYTAALCTYITALYCMCFRICRKNLTDECLANWCGGNLSLGVFQVNHSVLCLPYPLFLEAVRCMRISEAYPDMGPPGSTQVIPSCTLVALGSHPLHCSKKLKKWRRHVDGDTVYSMARRIPLRFTRRWTPWRFPQRTHPYSQASSVSPKTSCSLQQLR